MTILDFILFPMYAVPVLIIVWLYRKIIMRNKPGARYLMPALSFKVIASVFLAIIYFYYYKDGDTLYYFRRASLIVDMLQSDFGLGWKLLFADTKGPSDPYVGQYYHYLFAWNSAYFTVVRLAAIAGFFTFGSYLGMALVFSLMSFSGMWVLYTTFLRRYPKLEKELAYCILFIPSVIFWSSGVLKDALTLGAVGWLFYGLYNLFLLRRRVILAILAIAISLYLISTIKMYIAMAFLPAVGLWLAVANISKVKSRFLRIAITPFLLLLFGFGAFWGVKQLTANDERYALNNVQDKAEDMITWHSYVAENFDEGGGSFYSLGDPDFSTGGIIKRIPAAVNVTLFRPYIWEVNSPVMFLSFIESSIFLFFTLKLFWRAKGKVFTFLRQDPLLLFCLIFTIIFAFGVGLTSYNFGALVRYKIPCLPFYASFLVLSFHYYKQYVASKNHSIPQGNIIQQTTA